jgi:hypothetical protein
MRSFRSVNANNEVEIILKDRRMRSRSPWKHRLQITLFVASMILLLIAISQVVTK